jgi:NitT/TauT family transport system substrate-binding protein
VQEGIHRRPPWHPAFPIAASACAALALAACSRPQAPADATPARTPLSVQADWYAEAEQGGFYQAQARGFYREAGLDVTLLNGGPGAYPLQEVASGHAAFALGRSDDVILAVDRSHVPLMIVCAYMESDPMSVLVHDESPVRDFPDLAGRVVMADPASAWLSYLKAKYRIEFGIIPLNYGLAEFMADRNFIVQGFVTNEPYFVRRKGVAARTLLIANSGYRPYRVVIGNAGFIRAHPGAVRAFVAATIRGWRDFMEGDPAPARRLIASVNTAMTGDFMDFSTQAMRDHHLVFGDAAKGEALGLITRRRMQEQVDLFVGLKVLAKPLPLKEFVTFDFLPPELAALSR